MAEDIRTRCEGITPLSARLEPWQVDVCRRADLLSDWLDLHGSPINLLSTPPMMRNAAELMEASRAFGIDLAIYFARKANKALAFVDEAWRLGLGVDLASERELAQALNRGLPGSALVMTAAVKPASLLRLCISSGTTVVLDNADELDLLSRLAREANRTVSVALRLSPTLGNDRIQSRFGVEFDDAIAIAGNRWPSRLRIEGVHFHLDGHSSSDRVAVMSQALDLVDALRMRGHGPTFVDIGGGLPMSYLDDRAQWRHFWDEHHRALLGERDPLTFDGHGLGLAVQQGRIIGSPSVYPYHQAPTRGAWLRDVLSGQVALGGKTGTVAQGLRGRSLQLRCQPGRALLDGCGLTAARVVFRKQRRDGAWLVGLEMNRTQCRSTSDDFLVDPLLITLGTPGDRGETNQLAGPIEGYFVGAYCIERELLTWRRMRFPLGVRVGDIVVFPNTAGYLMHILESSSHQIPLARNLVVGPHPSPTLDPIDVPDY